MTHLVDTIACPQQEVGAGGVVNEHVRNSEGDVIELKDGRLLLAYTHFYHTGGDLDPSDIQGRISEDGGCTWSDPFQIQPNTARYSTGRLAFLRLRRFQDAGGLSVWNYPEDIALVYEEVNTCYENRLIFRLSHDEGQSWAREVQINDTGTLGHLGYLNGAGAVLAGGRILIPVYAQFGGLCASYMYYSDDLGESWRRGRGEISVPLVKHGDYCLGASWFVEPAVAELRDGRVICLGRTFTGRMWQAFSGDGGVTWSEAEPTELAASGSPAAVETVPGTGDLLCVWNQASAEEISHGFGRMRMSCAISKDDGKTWECFSNLDSLDDRTRIEPPERDAVADTGSEQINIKVREGLLTGTSFTKDLPREFLAKYPRFPGYCWNYYPSASFTRDGNVVFTYTVSDAQMTDLPTGLKVVVRPIEWLYEV